MGRPKTFDEVKTLETIGEHFRRFGYAGTSLDDIIDTTGLGKSSIYAAFGSKHEMFVRAFAGYCDQMAADTGKRLAGDDAKAFGRLERYVHWLAREFKDPRGCLLTKATSELGRHDAEIERMVSDAFDNLSRQLEACIAAAQRYGTIPAQSDPRQLAMMLLATLRGMESLAQGGASAATLKSIADGALRALRATAPALAGMRARA